jgi:hypothetical protein
MHPCEERFIWYAEQFQRFAKIRTDGLPAITKKEIVQNVLLYSSHY